VLRGGWERLLHAGGTYSGLIFVPWYLIVVGLN
jgi:hypothetical protein